MTTAEVLELPACGSRDDDVAGVRAAHRRDRADEPVGMVEHARVPVEQLRVSVLPDPELGALAARHHRVVLGEQHDLDRRLTVEPLGERPRRRRAPAPRR